MKNVKYLICVFLFILLLTGCSKCDLNLNIDSNDDIYITHTITTDKETYNVIKDLIYDDEDSFEKNGFSIKKISDNNYIGYEITSKIGSIKKVSYGKKDSSLELSDYSSNNKEYKNMFYVKNKFLYTSYTANITIDLTNINNISNNLPIFSQSIHSDDSIQDNDSLNNNVNTTFSLYSFYKIINSNNDSIDGNKYIWKLTYGKINNISFEMQKINYSTIIGIIFVLIVSLIVLFLYIKRNIAKNSYNKVNLKYSLENERKIIERSERREKSRPNIDEKNKILNAADSINSRLHNDTSLSVYNNQKTIEELKYDFDNKNNNDDK